MQYYVSYTEDCTPKVKVFESELEMLRFTTKLLIEGYGNDGTYVDFAFTGDIVLKGDIFKLEKNNG